MGKHERVEDHLVAVGSQGHRVSVVYGAPEVDQTLLSGHLNHAPVVWVIAVRGAHVSHRVPSPLLLLVAFLVGPQLVHDVLSSEPLIGVELQHVVDEVLLKTAHLTPHWQTLLLQHLQVVFHGHALVTGAAHQHLVEHDPDRPNITLLGIEVVLVGLRRHVLGRTDVIVDVGFVGDLFHRTVSEVDDADSLVTLGGPLEEDIVRLEVRWIIFFVFTRRYPSMIWVKMDMASSSGRPLGCFLMCSASVPPSSSSMTRYIMFRSMTMSTSFTMFGCPVFYILPRLLRAAISQLSR